MPLYTFKCEDRHEFTEWFSYDEYDSLRLDEGMPCEEVIDRGDEYGPSGRLCLKYAQIQIQPTAFRIRDIHVKITPDGTIDVQPEVW